MPLLADPLSVWDIAHRWAGHDPDSYRLQHPLLVKDYFKLLLEAILDGQLYCETLTLAKRPDNSKADPKYYIRTYLDEIQAGIWGVRYNKKLLKWASIPRDDFHEWCERLSIPLPDFWFPSGWKHHFEMPDFGTRAYWACHVEPDEPGGFALRFSIPDKQLQTDKQAPLLEDDQSLRANQKAKICSQQMAIQLWKEHPDRTITEMARDEIMLKYSGASYFGEEAIRKWMSEVAPVNVKAKRGRPKNKADKDVE